MLNTRNSTQLMTRHINMCMSIFKRIAICVVVAVLTTQRSGCAWVYEWRIATKCTFTKIFIETWQFVFVAATIQYLDSGLSLRLGVACGRIM